MHKSWERKIKDLTEASREVLLECSLPNGAIVAANSERPDYPLHANYYRFVWPRDAAFACVGADRLGLFEISEKFFLWMYERAEGVREGEVIRNAYYTSGLSHGLPAPEQFYPVPQKLKEDALEAHVLHTHLQPDQYGFLLWALDHHLNVCPNKHPEVLEKTLPTLVADGISKLWKGDGFTLPYWSLWEDAVFTSQSKTHHPISLAACINGLGLSINRFGKKSLWVKTKSSMEDAFWRGYKNSGKFLEKEFKLRKTARRSRGRGWAEFTDPVDSSLLGLTFPTEVLSVDDPKMVATVEQIIKKNMLDKAGLMRYPGDTYSSRIFFGEIEFAGAGSWPLLILWLVIVIKQMGQEKRAEELFWDAVNEVEEDNLIPEQVFPKGNPRVGVKPLLWSHMMFVHAAHELGYL